jgi:alkyl hydroperoxide reductase subunit AhpC
VFSPYIAEDEIASSFVGVFPAKLSHIHQGTSSMSVSVGQPAPNFNVKAYDRTKNGTDKEFTTVTLNDFKGKWVCLFFYPLDFTFVCPTELVAFNKMLGEFADRNCVVLTASTDSEFSHKGWCESHNDLKGMKYLMLADTTHTLARAFGVLKEDAGIAYRGIFLIDPNGVVRWLAVHDLPVGRNVEEVLRVLDALQTDKLCPCNWKKGEGTLN